MIEKSFIHHKFVNRLFLDHERPARYYKLIDLLSLYSKITQKCTTGKNVFRLGSRLFESEI